MNTTVAHTWAKSIAGLCAGLAFIASFCLADAALAAPPQKVTYLGSKVTTAVPGKPFKIKFRVKNTGSSNYSGIKVTFHLPGDLTASAVAPGSAAVDGNDIYWENVPLEAGKSFYPAFTLTLDSGATLKSKVRIWVEVTGKDMEATSQNFSITAMAAKKAAKK